MVWHYSNTAIETTLSAPITAVDLSMIVGTVAGLPVTFPYSLILDIDVAAREVVTVSAAAGTTLTIQRAQDGTSAGIHVAGAKVTHGVVARDVNEPQVHIAATTGVHGVGGSVVGTTGAQTLTGKSIDGSANTLSNVPMAVVTGNLDGARIINNLNLGTVTSTAVTANPAVGVTGVTVNGTGTRTAHLLDVNDAVKLKGLIFGDDGTTTLDNGDLYVDVRRAPGAATPIGRIYVKSNASKPALVVDRPAGNVFDLQQWRINGTTTASVGSGGTFFIPALTVGGVDVSGPWATWVPTLTNLTLGNGTQIARFRQFGKTVDWYWKFTLGTTSAVGTSPKFTLPVAQAAHYGGQLGQSQLNDASVGQRPGAPGINAGSTIEVLYVDTTQFLGVITATVPFTWTSTDSLACWGTYEAA